MFGKGLVPAAIQRFSAACGKPPPLAPNTPWIPPNRPKGLFLDYVTMAQGERGAYESPQAKAQRIARSVVLYLVDQVGGLPALAARMQVQGGDVSGAHSRADWEKFSEHFSSGVSGSCGSFVESIVRDTVRLAYYPPPLPPPNYCLFAMLIACQHACLLLEHSVMFF